jgi:CelD/BcsL family acetyltransferase involved in cellulose biosynthesis
MENTVSASLAEPIFATTPTPRDVAAWTPSVEPLRFFLGGRDLGAIQIPALTLNVPFTHLSTNLEDSAPPWETLPPGIEAAVVPAQPVDGKLPRLTQLPGLVRYVGPATDRYSIDLEGTFAGYLRRLSQNTRHTLRRKLRRFAESCGGELKWRAFTSAGEMREFHRMASDVSRRSWAARVGGPGFDGSVSEVTLLQLADENLVRGYVLFQGDCPVSYQLCTGLGDVLLCVRTGYDERHGQHSPGTILLQLLIEGLFAERRYKRLDLGEGTLGYKSLLSTDSTRCVRVIYFRRTFQNLAIASSHLALSASSIAAGKLLARIGMKQRLKRRMMGKMRRPGQ